MVMVYFECEICSEMFERSVYIEVDSCLVWVIVRKYYWSDMRAVYDPVSLT